jgi:signal transduction histidine kinase
LAIDAATRPGQFDREVQREWEQFLDQGRVRAVRAPVADSWRRSLDAGLDPAGSRLAPVRADRAEASTRWQAHPLAQAATLIHDCLASIADESDHLMVVSDAEGVLLHVEGSARVRSRAADSMNFTEGALWSENGAGTNAVGTALAADHAVQIFASEHFVEVVQAWTCSAAPVHEPETGELLGVVDLTALKNDVHPHSLAVAMTAARAVESHLRSRLQERDDRLRERYWRRIAGGADRRALVTPAGRLVADAFGGWLRGTRIEVPPGGGELVLPTGERAVAEPVGHEDAYIVRALGRSRLEKFAELVATAISNVQARSDLAASRARIVAAADDERRRVVRDLHDGAQQRLVHTVVTLKLARRTLERDEKGAGALVSEALAQAERATAELRELSHGILPAVLTRGGLRAGVEALATRMPVPVDIAVAAGRLPPTVEATAYFVVAEALTNVAKHARAQRAEVNARVEGGSLHVHVRDDGVGGAQPHGGGLVGLDDRLAVLNGQLRIDSPANGGTLVAAAIPLSAQ